MMLILHKGRHRPKHWWKWFAIWYDKKLIQRKFSFSFSCRYDLGGDDQHDHNKLFGLGYFWNKKDSARIGWRYDNEAFIMSAYCHVNGVIVFKDICEVVANREYIGKVQVKPGFYEFQIFNSEDGISRGVVTIPHTHKKKLSYALCLYFGGNKPAPKDMSLTLKRF